MVGAMFRVALRERLYVVFGGMVVVLVMRGAFALWGQGPFATSASAAGFRSVVWMLLLPAFAALLGQELAMESSGGASWLLARPTTRRALYWVRIAADVLVLVLAGALLYALAPVDNEPVVDLVIPRMFGPTILGIYGIAAVVGAGGQPRFAAMAVALCWAVVGWLMVGMMNQCVAWWGWVDPTATGAAAGRGVLDVGLQLGSIAAMHLVVGLLGVAYSRRTVEVLPRRAYELRWWHMLVLPVGCGLTLSVLGVTLSHLLHP